MKKIGTFLGLLCIAGSLQANTVSPSAAQAIGYSYFKKVAPAAVSTPNDLVLVKTETGTVNGASVAAYYVFNSINGGNFIIISADDNVEPILAYSTESSFDLNNISPDTKYWLNGYKTQILDVVQNHIQGSPVVAAKWASLQNAVNNPHVAAKTTSGTVAPLLLTKWDQENPNGSSPLLYNQFCPYDSNPNVGNAGRTLTGCVATAMAQTMKYWNWPDTGVSSNTYTQNPNPDNLPAQHANFHHAYHFSVMQKPYVTTVDTNVARLMYDAGVSVDMDYGTDAEGGSGSYVISATSPVTNCAEYALKTYFRYLPSLQGIRRGHGVYTSDTKWVDTMQNELDSSRVVIYSGQDVGGAGGHCWMLDGYNNDTMFHFNWGWSGASNGYYTIHALAPTGTSYDFISQQAAIIHIVPDTPANNGGGSHPAVINNVVEGEDLVKIFPNPATNSVFISLTGIQASEVAIMDLSGRELKHIAPAAGESLITVSVADVPSGMYIIRMQTNTGIVTRKIAITK
jgi:hypothetical protein